MRALPPTARYYLVGLWSAALLVGIGSLVVLWNPPSLPEFLAALIFLVMLTVADLTAYEMDNGRLVSIAVAVLIGALTSLTWPMLMAVIVAGTILGAMSRDLDWWQIVSTIAVPGGRRSWPGWPGGRRGWPRTDPPTLPGQVRTIMLSPFPGPLQPAGRSSP